MRIWRISNYAELSGQGGKNSAGRWNHLGRRIVYCSDHPSTCLLELLARFDPDIIPVTYQMLEISVPEKFDIGEVKLPDDWQNDESVTRQIWEEFCISAKSAILKVPSALMPQAHHYLLNPEHQDHIKIQISDIHSNVLDNRFYSH
ncbi:MAG: RES family NAD+ phosphorylase [Pseudomonadota bacterium]